MSSSNKLPDYDGATLAGVSAVRPSSGSSGSGTGAPSGSSQFGPSLQPGTVLSERYEILQLLGEGGMGSVYRAHDRALDRVVALKTIRPELARNASMLARFKQEVLVASQITHRNVVRLYDLGESDGLKFITMEFVEGDDLRTVLEQSGKLSASEAVAIMRQVCLALDAAHSQGVIHRDLKPQNIMREGRKSGDSSNSEAQSGSSGRIVVMDFGLARTLSDSGMTQTGALVGTMEYMSPEQALGQNIDVRSDIFAAGLIFYELLTGKVPYKADSAVASLLKRTTERAAPISDVDGSVPLALSNVVARCLERDREQRYSSAHELLEDLDSWETPHGAIPRVPRVSRPGTAHLYWASSIVLLLALLGGAGVALRHSFASREAKQAVAGPALSVAILPFRNASGDASMDWLSSSVPEMLHTDIGQSAQLRMVSSERVAQVAADLHMSSSSIPDPADLRRLAGFVNADVLISGQYSRVGDKIRIDAKFHELKTDRILPLNAEASSEKELVTAVDQLAKSIRESLSLAPDTVRELQARSFTPSSTSMEALRAFNQGLQLSREDKNLKAVKSFESAVQADPQFATAYAQLGKAYSAIGYDNQAEQAASKAVALSDKLPEPERYRIAALYAGITRDYPKAIGSYEQLAKLLPDDSDVLLTLASLYEQTGDFAKAGGCYKRILQRDPNSIDALLGSGRVSLLSGDTNGSLENLNRALTLSIQLQIDEERASVLQAIGVAYRSLSKPVDALRYFQESLDLKRRLKDQHGIANSLHAIAQVQNDLGKPKDALKNFEESIRIQREIGDTRGVGDTLLDLGVLYNDTGRYDDALSAFKESLQIERAAGNQNYEAINLNNIGTSYFFKGQYEDARTYYEQALQLREKLKVPGDIADTLHNLADTSTNTGDFDKAQQYYLRALEIRRASGDRRGAALDSYSMGKVFEQQGRYGAAVASMADSLKTLRDLGNRDYWLAEVTSGYGETLALAGRAQEAGSTLQDALTLARELNNQALIAQTINYQGDLAFYSGSFAAARKAYEEALPMANRAKDSRLLLLSKFGVARVAVHEGSGRSAVAGLTSICEKADSAGLKYLALDCSTYLGEAWLQGKEYAKSRQVLESALARSERLGLRPVSARAHLVMSRLLTATGNATEAENHARQARQIIQEISGGADVIAKRSDFAGIFAN